MKKTKKIVLVKKNHDQKYVAAILEDVNDKFSLLVEGQQILKESLENKMNDLTRKVETYQKDTESNFQTVFDHLSNIDDELHSRVHGR